MRNSAALAYLLELTIWPSLATNLLKVAVPLDSLEMREYDKWIAAIITLGQQKWFSGLQVRNYVLLCRVRGSLRSNRTDVC